MKKLISALVVIAVVATAMLPLAVYADPGDPDGVSIPVIYVNRSLLEPSDFLLVFEYNLDYTVSGLPTDPADVNYIFKLMDPTGVTQLGVTLPYPYNDLGYNYGIAAFYFNAADTLALLTWGFHYIIRIDQNPVPFTTPTAYDFVVPTGAYTALTSTEQNQTQLSNRILDIVDDLEIAWVSTLTESQDTGIVLDAAGESYIRYAIVGAQAMAPDIFFVQSLAADTTARVWGTSLSDTYKERLAGADGIYGTIDDNWIYTLSIKPVADALNIPVVLLFGGVAIAACVWLIYMSNKKFESPVAGYVGSLMIISCGGMLFLGLGVVAIIAFAMVTLGSYLLFLRKA